MSEAIVVNHAVRVPARSLALRAVRASGPGGQNVNKVATKVDLRVDLEAIEGLPDAARQRLQALARQRLHRARARRVDLEAIGGLPDAARQRLQALAPHRLDAGGRLVITSQVSRTQARNVED